MATKNPQNNPILAEDTPAESAKFPQSQAETAKPDDDQAKRKTPKHDEPIFFDTTISKVKKVDGEYVTVMSDNLYPDEELKSDYDERIAKERADKDAADNPKSAAADNAKSDAKDKK